ncbi:MAG: Rhodanese domain protein [Dehalococcoidia bacterium]|nr:Rhodanese domain protein [Dehalococcoidia bacterium]
MAEYASPEVLVDTQWVAQHLRDRTVRLVEVDVDTTAYEQGHIPGAVGWNWTSQTQDTLRRDILNKQQFEALMSGSGISKNATLVLYGDNNNWFAAYALWLCNIYGHRDLRLMNGGRKKWLDEGRSTTTDVRNPRPTNYRAGRPNLSLRASWKTVNSNLGKPNIALVDVRSPAEFTGEIMAPPGLSETAQRGGHIPGAASIPWGQAMREDGTFKSADELRALYGGKGVTDDKQVVAYCRIGERSSHSWFVLKYLLGYANVSNYDGSWTEWGSMVGNPIEKP